MWLRTEIGAKIVQRIFDSKDILFFYYYYTKDILRVPWSIIKSKLRFHIILVFCPNQVPGSSFIQNYRWIEALAIFFFWLMFDTSKLTYLYIYHIYFLNNMQNHILF